MTWFDGGAIQTHRLVYAQANGLNPRMMGGVVLHSCDNTRCVNIAHLSLGTTQSNVADRVTKGRSAKGESHGHAVLSSEQVQYIKDNYVFRHKELGGRAMAARFGVSESNISDIMRGRSRTGG